MQRVCQTLLISFLFLAGAVQNAAAQLETHLGPLASSVTLGVDGQWEARLQDGWFNLLNPDDTGAVRYYTLSDEPLRSGERVMALTTLLRGAGDAPAHGGIFFNGAADDRYMAFTIAADGTVSLFIRTPEGFDRNDSDNLRARLDGSDVLKIVETADSATLYLNDRQVFAINDANGFSPTYGIIAIGAGRFAFSRLAITRTATPDVFPQPGGETGGDGGGTRPFPAPRTDTGGGTTPIPPPTAPAPPPPQAPADPLAGASPREIHVAQVLMGTTLGVFFHEFGHALIGETGLPATGPEEDTADGFSAFVLGATVQDGDFESPAEQEFAERIAEYASLYWYYSGLQKARSGQQSPWQGEHAPDMKRFRNSFCILYGSNPGRYEDIAAKVQLEPRTKARCKAEFQKRYRAWEAILKTISRDLGPDSPGDFPANTPGGTITLNFQPSQSEVGKVVIRMLGDTGAMAGMLAEMTRVFVFPRNLDVEFRDCQEVNAWYDPQAGKVTMCYSLIEAASKLIFASESGGQPGGGQGADPVAFLVGSWQGSYMVDAGLVTITVTYAANGQYQSVADTPFGPIQIAGTWQARMSGQNLIVIDASPTRWSPRQICDNFGNCQPNQQLPVQVQVQILSRDSLAADGISWQRVR